MFDASTHSRLAILSISSNTCFLRAIDSNTASMMMSACSKPSQPSCGEILAIRSSAAAAREPTAFHRSLVVLANGRHAAIERRLFCVLDTDRNAGVGRAIAIPPPMVPAPITACLADRINRRVFWNVGDLRHGAFGEKRVDQRLALVRVHASLEDFGFFLDTAANGSVIAASTASSAAKGAIKTAPELFAHFRSHVRGVTGKSRVLTGRTASRRTRSHLRANRPRSS